MKIHKKSDFFIKPCVALGLPFTWRNQGEKIWRDVKVCLAHCGRGSKRSSRQALR
jgi:hypothetical protein